MTLRYTFSGREGRIRADLEEKRVRQTFLLLRASKGGISPNKSASLSPKPEKLVIIIIGAQISKTRG